MSITSRRKGRAILVQQQVDGARFSWNTVYRLEEARELIRQVAALLRQPPLLGAEKGCKQ